jgi:hypothetical protein
MCHFVPIFLGQTEDAMLWVPLDIFCTVHAALHKKIIFRQ